MCIHLRHAHGPHLVRAMCWPKTCAILSLVRAAIALAVFAWRADMHIAASVLSVHDYVILAVVVCRQQVSIELWRGTERSRDRWCALSHALVMQKCVRHCSVQRCKLPSCAKVACRKLAAQKWGWGCTCTMPASMSLMACNQCISALHMQAAGEAPLHHLPAM